MQVVDLYADGLLATPATDKAAVQRATDIAEICPELCDQRLHIQVGAMPAPLAHGVQAVVVRDEITGSGG